MTYEDEQAAILAQLDAALTENARLRHQLQIVEEALLAQAHNIGSASQARRIIYSIFRAEEKKP